MSDFLFVLERLSNHDGFISSCEEGYVISRNVRYCRVCFDINYYCDDLYEDYHVHFPSQLMTAVKHRKAEYLAGRYSAIKLFCLLNVSCHLHMANDRSPVWPEGIKGSISHTANHAIAIASKDFNISSIGVDIEECQKGLMKDIAPKIMSADELLLFSKSRLSLDTFGTVIFSAKETLFKALYPRVGKFFGFNAAKVIRILFPEGVIIFQLAEGFSGIDLKSKILKVNFLIRSNIVETVIVI